MEYRVIRVALDLPAEFFNSLGLGLEMYVLGEGSVEIDGVNSVRAGCVLGQMRQRRILSDVIHEPWLTSYITRVQCCHSLPLEEKHDRTWAVICIEKGDLDFFVQ